MNTVKILIIDDDFMVCSTLKVFLSDAGFNVYTVNSGEEAVEFLKKKKIDVCIVDMRLPNMDGNTLILESNKVFPDLKFIIHTGSMNYSPPKSITDLGITKDLVFKKPIRDMNNLIRAIHSISGKQDE